MITVRSYIDADYDELVVLLKEQHLYDPVWETETRLHAKIEKDPQSIVLACAEEKIVGAVFLVEDGWNAFVWRLCVKEKYKKQGIGSRLLSEIERMIVERGLLEVGLFVDMQNRELVKWYKKRNYKQGRDWTFMYKALQN